jgi:hypothetical protein
MAIGGLIGIILHSLKNIRSINKRIPEANYKMLLREYWGKDWLSLCTSIFCFIALLFVADEFINLKAIDNLEKVGTLKERLVNLNLATFVKLTSIIVGYFADSIVYGFMGVTEDKINKQLEDIKKKNESL